MISGENYKANILAHLVIAFSNDTVVKFVFVPMEQKL